MPRSPYRYIQYSFVYDLPHGDARSSGFQPFQTHLDLCTSIVGKDVSSRFHLGEGSISVSGFSLLSSTARSSGFQPFQTHLDIQILLEKTYQVVDSLPLG